MRGGATHRLEFGKGISDSDEPDLWRKDLAGMAAASMNLQCSIHDGEIWFRDDTQGAAAVEKKLDIPLEGCYKVKELDVKLRGLAILV